MAMQYVKYPNINTSHKASHQQVYENFYCITHLIKMTKTMKTLSSFILTALLVTYAIANSNAQCTSCSPWNGATVQIEYTDTYGSLEIQNVPYYTGMNVTVAMLNSKCVQSYSYGVLTFCPYGNYLNTVNGYGGSAIGYWQLSVNGAISPTGMDYTVLNAGDQISWNFIVTSEDDMAKANKEKSKGDQSHQEMMQNMHLTMRNR